MKVKSTLTHTDENPMTEDILDFLRGFNNICSELIKPKTFTLKSNTKSFCLRLLNGFKLIVPGQYTKPSNFSGISKSKLDEF